MLLQRQQVLQLPTAAPLLHSKGRSTRALSSSRVEVVVVGVLLSSSNREVVVVAGAGEVAATTGAVVAGVAVAGARAGDKCPHGTLHCPV